MASFIIEGGRRLNGQITPQGAKNEVLQVVCATLLTEEEVTIENIPDIADVNNLIQQLINMGVTVSRNGVGNYTFQAKNINLDYLESNEYIDGCAKLRGSVMFTGPLLARFGKAAMSRPGGDKIGRRRIDTHLIGLKKLGADFSFDEEMGTYIVKAKKLKGCHMLLDEASVTGTANIIMAAVFTKGTTVIYNAACEPYIQQLCKMLNRMGARISGIASNLLTIEGVKTLKGAPVACTDLRAGAAMIIAGLAASGTTEIEDILHIDRGYEDVVEKLKGIGADIKRVYCPDPNSLTNVG